LSGGVTPDRLSAMTPERLRTAGVSNAKASCVIDLSRKVASGELDFAPLQSMEDSEVIERLTQVKGIGKWTAKMFLIFSLGRKNVLSLGDVGLQRAARWLYENPEHVLKSRFEAWSPVNSLVSIYLWESVNRGYVDKRSPADL